MDTESKIQKLREFIDPVKAQWQTENIRTSLKSYDNFCQLLGLDKAQAYLANRRAHEISDWGSCALDEEGLALQAELDERLKVSWRVLPTLRQLTDCRLSRFDQLSLSLLSLWRDSTSRHRPSRLPMLSGRRVSRAFSQTCSNSLGRSWHTRFLEHALID